MSHFRSGELAERSGIGKETLRYYESIGIISAPPRTEGGYRAYPKETLHRLQFIKRAQTLGFELKEIQELLSLEEHPRSNAKPVREITIHRLQEIESKIEDLQRLRSVLLDLTEQCSGKTPISKCPILESLSGNPTSENFESSSSTTSNL